MRIRSMKGLPSFFPEMWVFTVGRNGFTKPLPVQTIEVSSGISSVVYFLGKLHMAWEDVCLMSVHGRQQNLIGAVRRNRKVFALVREKDGIAKICDRLLSYGMDQIKLYVGERLSYPEERITEGTAESLKDREFDALSVVLLVNEEPEKLYDPWSFR